MQQTPSLIEQIKTLYTNTNLPAALYGADGSVIWQNAAALYLAQPFPCEEWSAAAVRETATRISGNSGQPLSYQTVSLAYLWDMNEYYHVINDANESIRKALELLEQPDFEGLLLKKR